jgi:hypothetical protein
LEINLHLGAPATITVCQPQCHCADQFVYRASTFSHRRPMSITGIGYPQVFRLGSASKTLIRSRVVATLACVGMHDWRLGIEISVSHLGLHFLVLPAGVQLRLSAFFCATFTHLDGASVKRDSGAHRACRTDRDVRKIPRAVTGPLGSDTQSVGQWQHISSPP